MIARLRAWWSLRTAPKVWHCYGCGRRLRFGELRPLPQEDWLRWSCPCGSVLVTRDV